MEAPAYEILLFKTSIRTSADQAWLHEALAPLPLSKWSIDTEDVDCVLRIVSDCLQPADIIALVSRQGYYCTELL
jgi:hypothetical protein